MPFPTANLGTVINVKGGKRIPKGHKLLTTKTLHPYIRARDIGNGRITFDDPVYVSEATYPLIKNYITHKNDVCITIVGANVGDVGFVPTDLDGANLTENAVKLYPKNSKYDSKFLKYCLLTDQIAREMKQLAGGGAAQPKLGLYKIKKIEIPNPDILIQKKIASVLSTYDDLIESNERRIKILEEMAHLLYTEWFVKFKFPGHEKVKMVNSGTEYGMIPEGWEVKQLGDRVDIRKGKNITKNTISEGNIPVVAGGLTPAYFHNVSNAKGPVITVSASGANAGFVNLYQEDIWASDCSFIDRDATPHVYYYYILMKNRQAEITRLQRGSAQPHVYPKDLDRLTFFNPDRSLIENFEKKASILFQMSENLIKQNRKLATMRDLLIPQLVTGRRLLK